MSENMTKCNRCGAEFDMKQAHACQYDEALPVEDPVSKRLQKWKCHKVVEAGKIMSLDVEGGIIVQNEHGLMLHIPANAAWMEKHDPEAGGYLVRYEDGYESYSPAEAFEAGYTPIQGVCPTYNFGFAIAEMKSGNRVTRAGWNSKGMYVYVWEPDSSTDMTLPFIVMRTVQGDLVPWLASQTDMLSHDWMRYVG